LFGITSASSQTVPFIGSWISAEKSEMSDEFIELTFTEDSFTDSAGLVVPYKIESSSDGKFTISWAQDSAMGEVERKSSIQVISQNKIKFSWSPGLGDATEFNRKQ
jgi:hypothetical protein